MADGVMDSMAFKVSSQGVQLKSHWPSTLLRMLCEEGHCGIARGVIIRQIERVSFTEDPAGGIELGVGNGLREAEWDGGGSGREGLHIGQLVDVVMVIQ